MLATGCIVNLMLVFSQCIVRLCFSIEIGLVLCLLFDVSKSSIGRGRFQIKTIDHIYNITVI